MLFVYDIREGNDERERVLLKSPETMPEEILLREQITKLPAPALAKIPHHSATRPTALSPHATPPSEPQLCEIIWRGRSLRASGTYCDIGDLSRPGKQRVGVGYQEIKKNKNVDDRWTGGRAAAGKALRVGKLHPAVIVTV